jgi:hypothetical protein
MSAASVDAQPAAVIAIGGSAGSVPQLQALLSGLPASLPAAVLITIHIGEQTRSKLPQILSRAGSTVGAVAFSSSADAGPPFRVFLRADVAGLRNTGV